MFAGMLVAGVVLVGASESFEQSVNREESREVADAGAGVRKEHSVEDFHQKQPDLETVTTVALEEGLEPAAPSPLDRVTVELIAPDVGEGEVQAEAEVQIAPEVDTETRLDLEALSPAEIYLELCGRRPPSDGLLNDLLGRWRSGPSSVERRTGIERLTCDLRAWCRLGEKTEGAVSIANIGVGGLEIYSTTKLPLKARVEIRPHHDDEFVRTRVVWCLSDLRGYRVGLEFDQEPEGLAGSWVAVLMHELGAEYLLARPPRRFVRVSTALNSSYDLGDGQQVAVTLLDVSLGGCLLRSPEKLEREELSLDLGGVACRGKVVSVRSSEQGWMHHLRFESLSRLESARLRRSIRYLLSAQQQQRSLVVEARPGEQAV